MEWESFSAPGGGEGPRAFALHPPGELVSDLLRRDRTWEGVESALLRAALRPGSVVVDAGANLGWHAVWAALAVGAEGRVYAFEPDPRNLALLRANGAGLPQLRALGAALGEARGEVAFRRHGDNQGDSARVRTDPSFTVPCWPGDALARFSLANALMGTADTIAAELHYRRAIALNPEFAEAWNNLAYALHANGCRDQALTAARCAGTLAPGDTAITGTLEELRGLANQGPTGACEPLACPVGN